MIRWRCCNAICVLNVIGFKFSQTCAAFHFTYYMLNIAYSFLIPVFHSTALLKEHMACHAVNPFLCTRCSFTGNTEASLWNHGNDVHRESIEESSNCNKKTIAHQALSDRKFKLMPAYGADEKNATVDVCDAQMLALKHTADPAIELKGICAVCGVEGGMFAETGTAPATISCIKCLGSLKSQSFPDPPTISGMKTEDHSSVEDFNLVHCSDLETMSRKRRRAA